MLAELEDRTLADRLRDVLVRWLDLPKDLPTPLLQALGNADLAPALADDAIDALCRDPKTLDELVRDPEHSRAWICFAVSHSSLPDALAAKVTITDGKNTLEQRLERRLALSAGFGARFLDVVREPAGAAAITVHDCARTSLTFDAGIEFVF